jgi:diguanylate cyclase (GGDEF)-like protein
LAGPEPDDEVLLAQAHARARERLGGRDSLTSLLSGGGFLAAAAALAARFPWHATLRPETAALLVLMLALTSRVEFEVGTGSVVPTELVLVPMLLLLPAPVVPLCVAAGYVLGGLIDNVQGRRHPQRLAVLLGSCWHSVGPALLLALFAASTPRWHDAPLYLAALASQFAFDFASSAGREWLAFGISPRRLLPYFRWVYAVDVLLAPVGLLAAFASVTMRYAFVLMVAPAAFLWLLARERRGRIERAQAFQDAFDSARVEARRDALTGLANRLAWEEAVERADAVLRAGSAPVSLILVDVDRLKEANDGHGHEFGDEVLRQVAALVRATVREQDVVARLGGDEIAVLLPGADALSCAEALARLEQALAGAPVLDGFPLSAAVGSATASRGSVADAQRLADLRMYAQKAAGRRHRVA